nr:MAG TPA: hypothetical protein [Caudoviricetes sp.]
MRPRGRGYWERGDGRWRQGLPSSGPAGPPSPSGEGLGGRLKGER